jgi:hypothetical protein
VDVAVTAEDVEAIVTGIKSRIKLLSVMGETYECVSRKKEIDHSYLQFEGQRLHVERKSPSSRLRVNQQ